MSAVATGNIITVIHMLAWSYLLALLALAFAAGYLVKTLLGGKTAASSTSEERGTLIEAGSLPMRLDAELKRARTLDRYVGLVVVQLDSPEASASRDFGQAAVASTRRDEMVVHDQAANMVQIVLVDHMDAGSVQTRAAKVRSSIAEAMHSSASAGVAIFPEVQLDGADLIAASLLALDHTAAEQMQVYDVATPPAHPNVVRFVRPAADARLQTAAMLAQALDMRDADTARHSHMVAWLCQMIAWQLGMAPTHIERMRVAGLVHDIGKIGIPDDVLNKPSKLTDAEYEMMQRHPEIGAQILQACGDSELVDWILSHHERPDGRGYPRALGSDEIALEAKIIAVADSWEAMTADRVYRKAPGAQFALSELRRCGGSQFDSSVAQALIEALDCGVQQLEGQGQAA